MRPASLSSIKSWRVTSRPLPLRIAERRYRIGIDSNLTFLDAQRSLLSAQQALSNERLAQLTSEVNLYKALGDGWREHTNHRRAPKAPAEAGDPSTQA